MKQEELYVVLRGSGRMKVDDEIVELKEWDAVRVPPGTWRGYEAGPEGLEILVIGAPNLGEDPREDVDGQRDWWADTFNLNSDESDGTRDREGWRAKGALVGQHVGGELIGATMSEVEPGGKLWPYHTHHLNEEWVIVLSRRADVAYARRRAGVEGG